MRTTLKFRRPSCETCSLRRHADLSNVIAPSTVLRSRCRSLRPLAATEKIREPPSSPGRRRTERLRGRWTGERSANHLRHGRKTHSTWFNDSAAARWLDWVDVLLVETNGTYSTAMESDCVERTTTQADRSKVLVGK